MTLKQCGVLRDLLEIFKFVPALLDLQKGDIKASEVSKTAMNTSSKCMWAYSKFNYIFPAFT
jgi:hypothetical protein